MAELFSLNAITAQPDVLSALFYPPCTLKYCRLTFCGATAAASRLQTLSS
jgi:hypothetical protein